MLHEIKVISCNQTRYKPSLETRAVAKRADQLHQEYVEKQKLVDYEMGFTILANFCKHLIMVVPIWVFGKDCILFQLSY